MNAFEAIRFAWMSIAACVLIGLVTAGCEQNVTAGIRQPELTGSPPDGTVGGPTPNCGSTSPTDWAPALNRSLEMLSGPIQSIDEDGYVAVMGFQLEWGACTGVFDILSSFADPQPIAISDLSVGDSVEIPVGRWVPVTGEGIALRIARRPADNTVEIRGWFVEWADRASATFSVHGNTFHATGDTRFFAGHQNFGDGPNGCSCVSAAADDFWNEVNGVAYAIFGVVEVIGILEQDNGSETPRLVATEVYWYYI